jgi:hypothetical protein
MKTFLPKFTRCVIGLLWAFFCSNAVFAQTITTNQLDYFPGEEVIITGTGFSPDETITLQIVHTADDPRDNETHIAHAPWSTVADANGSIDASWYVPADGDELGATLILTADGQSSLLHAEATFTDSISITGPPQVTACVGTSVTFSSSISGVLPILPAYQWQFSTNNFASFTNIPGATASTYTINPVGLSAAGMYRLQAVSAFGLGTFLTNQVTLTVNPSPTTPLAGTDQAVCSNTATLAGNTISAGLGVWTLVSGAGTITTSGSPTSGVTNLGLGTNTFRWTSTLGSCSFSDTVIITFTTTPAMPGTITSNTTTICSNQTGISYTVAAVPLATTYTWTVPTGWNITAGQGTTSITVTSGVSGQNGDITVTAGSPCGTSSARTLAVSFVDDIGFNSNVSSDALTICAGSVSNTIIGGDAPMGPNYQWQVSINGGGFGNAVGSSTGGNYTIDPFYYNNIGSYVFRRVISSSTTACNGNSDLVTLSVLGATANAGNALAAICQGGTSAPLGGSAGGLATGGIWSDGGIGGSFNPNATTLNATWTPPAAYSGTATLTLTTTGGACSSTSASKNQLVNPLPTNVLAGASLATICNGTSANLNASANVTSGTITTLLSDNFNGGSVFSVAGSNNGGGTIWGPQNSPFNVLLVANWSSPDASRFMLAYAASLGNATTSSTLTTSPVINSTGYSSLSLSFKHTYKQGDVGSPFGSVEVSTDPGNLIWTPVATYTSNVGSAGSFATVTGINLNAYVNQSNLRFRFNFDSSVSFANSWWAIDDVVLSGNLSSVPQYSWTASPPATGGLPAGAATPSSSNANIAINPTATTTYTLTATDPVTGCSRNASNVIITVNQKSSNPVSATASISPTCPGDPSVLTLNGPNTGTGEVVRWYTDAACTLLVAGQSGAGNNFTVNPTTTTTYWGRFENPAPCNYNSPAQSATVTVNTPAFVDVQPTNQSITYGANASFTISAGGTNPITYLWKVSTDNGLNWNDVANTLPFSGYSNFDSNILSITMPTVSMNGYQYQCVVTNVCGTATSTPGILTVSPKSVTAGLTGLVSKTYDGDAIATLVAANYTLTGLISPDAVQLNNPVTGSYDDRNVGSGKLVSVAGLSISGADSGNYVLSASTASANVGTITARDISGIFTVSPSRVYNAGTLASVLTRDLTGVLGTDDVSLTGGVANYDTKDVGTNKTVALTGAGLSGLDAGNYHLTTVATTTANITPKALLVSATGINKVYDTTTDATVTISDNRILGDIFTVSYLTNFVDANVGNGKTVNVTGISLSGLDALNYTPNSSTTTTANITPLAVSTSVTVTPATQQYSDVVAYCAKIAGGGIGTLAATSVTFKVGTQVIAANVPLVVSGTDLVAKYSGQLLEPSPFGTAPTGQMAPGVRTVTAVINGANSNFTLSNAQPTTSLTITKEDARINFTGTQLLATASSTSGLATVLLKATVQDISATPDNAGDTAEGDIRNAKVRFLNSNVPIVISGLTDANGYVLSGISLVNPADTKTGIVSLNWPVNIGTATDIQYTISMEVNNYYTRSNQDDNTVITVYKSDGDFITGGGYIVPTQSFGQYAADSGRKTNFGFNVKFKSGGKNLQGNMNIIFRRTVAGVLRTYQIKANAMTSLGVNVANPNAKVGVFVSKANLTDITTGTSISLGGNLTLQVDLTDRGEPGANDDIAISLSNGSTLLYSSKWIGNTTALQLLGGGNLVVHSGFSVVQAAPTTGKTIQASANTNFEVTAYPNPSATNFNLVLKGSSKEATNIELFDVTGKLVKQYQFDYSEMIIFGDDLPAGAYTAEVQQGDQKKFVRVIKQ